MIRLFRCAKLPAAGRSNSHAPPPTSRLVSARGAPASAVPASVPASSGAAGPAAFSGSTASGGGGGCECVHAIATIKPVQRMWTPLLLLLLLVDQLIQLLCQLPHAPLQRRDSLPAPLEILP